MDRWSGWHAAYPAPDRTAGTIVHNLQHFACRRHSINYLYFDNAGEYLDAATQLGIQFGIRDANRLQPNGVAERAVRSILERTRPILYQSGLPHCYWADAAGCFAFPQNIHGQVRDTNQDAYFRRFGYKFNGLKIPCGSLVLLKSSAVPWPTRIHSFCPLPIKRNLIDW